MVIKETLLSLHSSHNHAPWSHAVDTTRLLCIMDEPILYLCQAPNKVIFKYTSSPCEYICMHTEISHRSQKNGIKKSHGIKNGIKNEARILLFERHIFIHHPAHTVPYILDPRYARSAAVPEQIARKYLKLCVKGMLGHIDNPSTQGEDTTQDLEAEVIKEFGLFKASMRIQSFADL